MSKTRTNERRSEMERLTVPDKKIDGGLRRAIIDAREVRKEAMTIYWALKKYEDTELTPEQIMGLKERDTAKKPVQTEDGMVCPICGSKAVPWSRFCDECGQRWWEEED